MPKIIFLYVLPRIFSSKNVAGVSVTVHLMSAWKPFAGSLVIRIKRKNNYYVFKFAFCFLLQCYEV